ncbi:hypothetical protein CC86DRAFT_371750 [Ophiobolus disseminans]|uniref:Uncharacterized protein n=1 Tax=Ophiobolus disseminans TaxID=1469910 RepID=A0A6A6ZVQ4_9PLEO|nr:hypothetical protein CC86DRAFT_371750 [Ophiobolus disseminans]
MRHSTKYEVLDDENTEYSNYYEPTTFQQVQETQSRPQEQPSEYDQASGNRLQRFYVRALVGTLGPFAVCAYFIVIWRLYIVPADESKGPLTFGKQGATWIFYSWFVAGVLGLSLSLYGLAGVEASMLMEWSVGDATRLMLHADTTWSGPGGWLKTIKWAMSSRSGVRCRRSPAFLWYILAFPSMLVFVAWPFSGLTMEVTDGYHHSNTIANMTGFSYDTFNERGTAEAYDDAALKWSSAHEATIPGAGIVYTPEGFDRSKLAFLNQLPAVLPKDDGVPTIFLAAQANKPAEGNVWGLLLQYNCSVIHKAQDFQIINKAHEPTSSGSPWAAEKDQSFWFDKSDIDKPRLLKDRKSAVVMVNQTDGSWCPNLQAAAEVGFQLWTDTSALPMSMLQTPDSSDCYLVRNQNETRDYPGIHQEQILELALWQRLRPGYIKANFTLQPNYLIDYNITDYFGMHDVRDFQGLSEDDFSTRRPLPMTAIGVQCRASSSVGSADINGVKSSFSNFRRTDTPFQNIRNRCARRFTAATPYYMLSHWTMSDRWLPAMFKSAAAPPPFSGSSLTVKIFDLVRGRKSYDLRMQLSFLQAEQLRRAMLQAYASYAMSLMYSGEVAMQNGTFLNPNATEFVSGLVITPGVMPSLVPLALFCIWALISSALGVLYGFRRRWTETLDGHTMFRMGAELADHDRRELLRTSNILKEDCVALDDIPGLVGDTKPEIWLGRIGLVKKVKADKKKLYE